MENVTKLFDEAIVNCRDHAIRQAEALEQKKQDIIPLSYIDVSISDDGFPEGSALGVVDKLSIAIPLKGAINISDEINRLNKEIDKIQNEIEKFQKNLNNENFINRAPRDIIDEIRNKLNINFDKKSKIQDAINRLKN